jgi:hypothetical protein
VRPEFPVGASRYLSLAMHLVAGQHGVECHHVLLFKLNLKLPPTIPGLKIEKMRGEGHLWPLAGPKKLSSLLRTMLMSLASAQKGVRGASPVGRGFGNTTGILQGVEVALVQKEPVRPLLRSAHPSSLHLWSNSGLNG